MKLLGINIIRLGALCALGVVATLANADNGQTLTSCSDGMLNPGYTDCSGAFAGNNLGNESTLLATQSNILSLTGSYYPLVGTSTGAGNGPFTGTTGSNTGTLTFDGAGWSAPFVLALKADGGYSLYYYDAGAGTIPSITFDTQGVAVNQNDIGAGLSHASLYGGVMAAVPEPEKYALMLAGLGLVGFIARRRLRRA